MNIRFNSVMLYTTSALLYVYLVLSNKRDYQDSWILKDILIPTLIFIFIFITIVIINNDNKVVALICSSFVVIINLVPALKYELFYGIPDTTFHYRIIYDIMNSGYVPNNTVYSGAPGMHILVSLSSLILGISANAGFKFIIPIMYGIYPLIVYFVSNRLIYDKVLIKYIIIASAFPLITAYYYSGTIFPLPILILLGPLVIIGEVIDIQNRVQYRILLFIMLSAILISHTITPLLFLIFSTGSILFLILYKKYQREQNNLLSILIKRLYTMLFFATVLFVFWWMYESNFLFSVFAKNILHLFVRENLVRGVVPHRFFEISFEDKIKILSVSNLKDVIIAMLCMFGLITYVRKKEKIDNTKIFYLYIISFIAMIVFILIFEFLEDYSNLEYQRFINYGIVFSPFFVGLSFYQFRLLLDKKLFGIRKIDIVIILTIFVVIISSVVEFYPYQPIVPKASVIYKDLPEDEPLIYFHHVNTIYQEKMISFASEFSTQKDVIISDTTTRLQAIAFFNLSLNDSRYLWESILTPKAEYNWNLLLLHWNGVSGPFFEQAEYRSKDNIIKIRNSKDRNTIYDNGESFIIQRQNNVY